ncbi:hypothetical protein CRX72_23970 [Pantoea sp. BRM17]|nr:hypothetical protein CRX72_23970 [Pantoea sp. BRM17]
MCDIADDASDLEILNVEIALANRPKTAIEFTGKCHYCEEAIDKGRYCTVECRDDGEKIERAKLRGRS